MVHLIIINTTKCPILLFAEVANQDVIPCVIPAEDMGWSVLLLALTAKVYGRTSY